MTGKVKTLTEKGYGFLEVPGQQKDMFFHLKSLNGVRFEELQTGDNMVFDVEESDKGPHAINVERAD